MRRVFAVLCFLAVSAGAMADAHTTFIRTRLRRTSLAIEGGDTVDKVGGVVRSPRAKCLVGRKVVVKWIDEDLERELYGITYTDINGNWAIDDSGPTGERYIFAVRRKGFGPTNHRRICQADGFHEVLH